MRVEQRGKEAGLLEEEARKSSAGEYSKLFVCAILIALGGSLG